MNGVPDGPTVISGIFPLAVLGQSAYSFLLLAGLFKLQLPLQWESSSEFLKLESTGPVLYAICFSAGFVLWAISTAWIAFAALSIGHVALKRNLTFGPAYWSLIFPNVGISLYILFRSY
jgi:tellurite resistance protein TehA-like permease